MTEEPPIARDAAPRQLTTGPDLDPAWDPRGGAIAFMTSKPGATDRPYDIGAVAPDGTGERVMASGPNRDIGIGGELSWVGKTGLLMTNERIFIHEYMTFDSAKAPFDRTVQDGNDAAFTRRLVIPGGMGGDGVSVSRDGKTVMWMIRTSHNPASWVVTIRTADVGALNGQSAIDFGNVVWTHSGATDGPNIPRGFSLAPDAGFFVMSVSIRTDDGSRLGEGYDLFVLDSSTEEEIRRLTTSGSGGVHNLYPDVSPDGQQHLPHLGLMEGGRTGRPSACNPRRLPPRKHPLVGADETTGTYGAPPMTEQPRCTNCGAVLGSDASFCASCGAPTQSTAGIKCPTCGGDNPDHAQFCVGCGASLSAPAAIGATPQGMVSFTTAISLGFKRYFDFSGRSTRAELWWWMLFCWVVAAVLSIFATGATALFSLAVVAPSFAVGARRLHDTGRSALWLLPSSVAVVVILLYVAAV